MAGREASSAAIKCNACFKFGRRNAYYTFSGNIYYKAQVTMLGYGSHRPWVS
jgi:hypothetical protein